MKDIPAPYPLFDTLENMEETACLLNDYFSSHAIKEAKVEYTHTLEFLKSYANSKDTFTSYRREVERLLQWSWFIMEKPLKAISRNDIRDYLHFVAAPPKNWLGTKIVNRFTLNAEGVREPHPEWRPFVVRLSKINKRHGKFAEDQAYSLSSKSMEAIFAVLSSFYTYLQQEEYVDANPIALIRQKKGFIQRQQNKKVTRKLSRVQWECVIDTAEKMAAFDPQHERTLFLMSAFYLLGLRISELADSNDHPARMGNFAPDKRGLWWYTTIGKGNKMRDVAVPDELLAALKRYRESLNLSPLPHREEDTPLFLKLKGREGLGARQIRNIVQSVFDQAILTLQEQGKMDEAEDLATATVHWLRHTAISSDVEFRPREHIRDDVGHDNPGTMDKYIDIDRLARHQSAQGKKLRNPT